MNNTKLLDKKSQKLKAHHFCLSILFNTIINTYVYTHTHTHFLSFSGLVISYYKICKFVANQSKLSLFFVVVAVLSDSDTYLDIIFTTRFVILDFLVVLLFCFWIPFSLISNSRLGSVSLCVFWSLGSVSWVKFFSFFCGIFSFFLSFGCREIRGEIKSFEFSTVKSCFVGLFQRSGS